LGLGVVALGEANADGRTDDVVGVTVVVVGFGLSRGLTLVLPVVRRFLSFSAEKSVATISPSWMLLSTENLCGVSVDF
jgi:hypothetical protein